MSERERVSEEEAAVENAILMVLRGRRLGDRLGRAVKELQSAVRKLRASYRDRSAACLHALSEVLEENAALEARLAEARREALEEGWLHSWNACSRDREGKRDPHNAFEAWYSDRALAEGEEA